MNIVKWLINVGVDVNLGDGYGILLIVVCWWRDLKFVKELIKVGVDVNLGNEIKIFLIIVCNE